MNPILEKIITDIGNKVSQENKQAYADAVEAGLRIMFDPKTHANMEIIKNPDSRKDPVDTVSQGVSGLVWLMFQHSNRTMKSEVLVASGTALLMHAIDFWERGLSINFDQSMIAQAMKNVTFLLLQHLGISQDQLQAWIQKGQQGGQPDSQPDQQPDQQPQPSGLLGSVQPQGAAS